MLSEQTNTLFNMQAELIDMKVDVAVNKAIGRVMDGIADLKDSLNKVEHRLIAVETKLGIVNETKAKFLDTQKHVRTNFIDYSFKAGWFLLAAFATYVLANYHFFIK